MRPAQADTVLEGDSPEARLAVAGGITPEHFTAIQRYRPAIAVVGGFVTGAADPRAAAQSIREALSSMT